MPLQATDPQALFWPPASKMPSPRSSQDLTRRHVRVLLVEDNPDDALLATELLREGVTDYSWSIQTAATMDIAIMMLTALQFDLIFIDLNLEDTTGIGTVDLMCLVAPYVPIVVYTGSSDDTLLAEAIKRGAAAYIQKSEITSEKLKTLVMNLIDKK